MPGVAVMSLADAAFNTAHDYPGGADALGRRMGKSNLSAEVNPNVPGAKLGLLDARKMVLLSGDFRIVTALNLDCGFYPPLPMPATLGATDLPCLATLADLLKECADVVSTVSTDAGDGVVSANDLARAHREWSELVACGQRLMGQLAAMYEAQQALAPKDGAA